MSTEFDSLRHRLDVAAIEEYTAGVIRARREYADHAFITSCHGSKCGCAWEREIRLRANVKRAEARRATREARKS